MLTAAEVLAIRAAYASGGVTQAALGQRYGVATSSIHAIVSRANWRHLPDPAGNTLVWRQPQLDGWDAAGGAACDRW